MTRSTACALLPDRSDRRERQPQADAARADGVTYPGLMMTDPTAPAALRPARAGLLRGLVVVLLLVLGLTATLTGCGGDDTPKAAASTSAGDGVLTPTWNGDVQVFQVVGLATMEYSATELVAEPGRIQIDFSVAEGSAPHNFVINEIPGATTDILSAGESQTITFTVDQPGSYQIICTLHPNMTATLKII